MKQTWALTMAAIVVAIWTLGVAWAEETTISSGPTGAAVAGPGIVSGVGSGVGASAAIGYRSSIQAGSPNGNMSAGTGVSVGGGGFFHKNDQGQWEAPVLSLDGRLFFGGGGNVQDREGGNSGGVSSRVYLGGGYDRNVALDRAWRGRAILGGEGRVRFQGNAGSVDVHYGEYVAAGAARSGDKTLPFIEFGARGGVIPCLSLSSGQKDALCADLWAGVAAGLIQLEVQGGAGVQYQHKISDTARFYTGVEGQGAATLDLAGGHSYTQGLGVIGVQAF